jgi:hypothetical protein
MLELTIFCLVRQRVLEQSFRAHFCTYIHTLIALDLDLDQPF